MSVNIGGRGTFFQDKMFLFWQNGCICVKLAVAEQNACIWKKMFIFGQMVVFGETVVIFGRQNS